jgi:hypothetical protein
MAAQVMSNLKDVWGGGVTAIFEICMDTERALLRRVQGHCNNV